MSTRPISATSTSATASSLSPPLSKSITRDLLHTICKKHFTTKSVLVAQREKSHSEQQKEYKRQLIAGITSPRSRVGGASSPAAAAASAIITPQTGRIESLDQYMRRCTHLQLDHLKLTQMIPSFQMSTEMNERDMTFQQAKMLRVLYLHDNLLDHIDPLTFCAATLSHLYLSSNMIRRITNLWQMKSLEKLYIEKCELQKLEGFTKEDDSGNVLMSNIPSPSTSASSSSFDSFPLIELHIGNQRLPPTLSFQLSIPSLQALSSTLTILMCQHNQMDDDAVLPVSLLVSLTHLNLSGNRIREVRTISEEITPYLTQLKILDLRENVMNETKSVSAVQLKKYRDKVIMSNARIELLDDKPVLDNQRDYLHSLAAQQQLKKSKRASINNANEPTTSASSSSSTSVFGHAASESLSPKHNDYPSHFTSLPLATTTSATASPQFPYQQRMLTQQRASQLGTGGGAAFHSQSRGVLPMTGRNLVANVHSSTSPFFDDDDPHLGGASHHDQSNFKSSSSSTAESDTKEHFPGMPYTGDASKLGFLLQTRGLQQQKIGATNRRATLEKKGNTKR